MTRIAAIAVALCLTGFAAATEPMLPRCSEALDGQFSEGGCSCSYDRGGILTGHAPGWRWKCDLLRGPGPTAPMVPAGQPAPDLPPGFSYSPRSSSSSATGGTTSDTRMPY